MLSDPNYIFESATACEIQSRCPDFAVLPIGSFEQHGPHLPMETDTLISCSIARRIVRSHNCFMISPITASCSHEHSRFFPSLWISPSTLNAVVKDLADSLEFHGLKKLCIVNAHGGNYILEHFAQIENMAKNKVLLLTRPNILDRAIKSAGLEHSPKTDMHAGEYETSVLLADYPSLVRRDRVSNHAGGGRQLFHLHGMYHYSESGVIGYPEQASAEKGERVMSELIILLKPLIDEFISLGTEKTLNPRYPIAQLPDSIAADSSVKRRSDQ